MMMKRSTFIFCSSILLFPSSLLSQVADPGWLSWSRVSVSASGSYYLVPWKKYNESMKLVEDAIQYSPSYQNPRGALERINGDGTAGIAVSYRIYSGLSVLVSSSYLTGGGSYDVTYGTSFPSQFTQKMRLHVWEHGAGLRFTHAVGNDISISVFGLAQRSFGRLVFDFHYVPSYTTDQFSADLRDKRWSGTSGIDIQYRVFHDLSLITSVEYRWLKFQELQGNGTYADGIDPSSNRPGYAYNFSARLGEADGYFGLMIPREFGGYVPIQVLHILWGMTPAQQWWYTEKPTALDLSGIGIRFGVQYEF
jgi:hypothetical protein